ncbi:MAG: NACHT domain-containing protein [Egibacteraceae bacterium]
MDLVRSWWRSAAARRRLAVTVGVSVAVVLGLWAAPREVAVTGWHWVRGHVAVTVAVAGLVVAVIALVAQFLVPWLQRGWGRRDAVDDRRRARDREVMLKRVRNRWIAGVLEQSLAHEARIRLGLTRRPEVIWQPGMLRRRPSGQAELLPAGTPISAVFDQLGGGLLIPGAPGSGKTTALLELARDLLKDASTDQAKPIPVVFNLSSWAARQPPLAEWLADELHRSYDVAPSIAQRWVDGSEILPLLDGLDEVAKAHRAGCVEAINAYQAEHGLVRVVVCSRTEEYTAAARLLRVEEAIELAPQPASR